MKLFAKMRGIRTQAILGALKNTLVWMKSDGKEKAQGVAVVDLLRPAGLFCFAMLFAKIACFYLVNVVPYLFHNLKFFR